MSYIAGRLDVYLDQAKLEKNVGGLLDKQDPYCQLIVGNVTHRSRTREDAAVNPVWAQNFSFPLTGTDPFLTIICKDENVGTDTIIGTCSIPLNKPPAPGPTWVELNKGSKRMGSVLLTLNYVPANVAVPYGNSGNIPVSSPAPGAGYPGAGYPAAAPAPVNPAYPHTQPAYTNYAPPPQQYPAQQYPAARPVPPPQYPAQQPYGAPQAYQQPSPYPQPYGSAPPQAYAPPAGAPQYPPQNAYGQHGPPAGAPQYPPHHHQPQPGFPQQPYPPQQQQGAYYPPQGVPPQGYPPQGVPPQGYRPY